MCGILATVNPACSPEQAARALRALRHRGPEGDGVWRSAAHDVLLGHTRLSIIDLPGGSQPMVNETGDLALVVNGEFYGHDRIIAALERRGHRFHSRCDSEILLHLYEDYGLDAVHHLRGEFAFALWDERHARLIAGRDRFGVKPLFYSTVRGGVWLGSEAKALFAAGLPAVWDEESFYQHLFLMHDADRSLFGGVRQLAAGHLLVFEAGQLRTVRYWDLDYPRQDEPVARPETEPLEAFREALQDAINVRLRADTPVGYFLSGGIDSSAVVGLASRHWDTPGRAFTVRFDREAYDEGTQACQTAASVGAAFTPIPLSQTAIVDAYVAAIEHAETTGNLHAAARYLQCRAVHDAGYKVALTGDGADEVLAGYMHYASDVAGDGAALPAALRPMRARLGHTPTWVAMLAVERSVFQVLLARDYRERMKDHRPYADCLDAIDCEGQLAGRDPLHQSLYLWNKLMLPNYVLGAERLEMAFAVETRPPFLDHRLFDVVRGLPPGALVSDRQGKMILRRAAQGAVPDAVIAQRKHPFAAPSALSEPGSPLFRLVDELFRDGVLQTLPFFDPSAVLALWTSLPDMPPHRRLALEPVVLTMFCACVLHRRYVDA